MHDAHGEPLTESATSMQRVQDVRDHDLFMMPTQQSFIHKRL